MVSTEHIAIFCIIELEYASSRGLELHKAELAWFDGVQLQCRLGRLFAGCLRGVRFRSDCSGQVTPQVGDIPQAQSAFTCRQAPPALLAPTASWSLSTATSPTIFGSSIERAPRLRRLRRSERKMWSLAMDGAANRRSSAPVSRLLAPASWADFWSRPKRMTARSTMHCSSWSIPSLSCPASPAVRSPATAAVQAAL